TGCAVDGRCAVAGYRGSSRGSAGGAAAGGARRGGGEGSRQSASDGGLSWRRLVRGLPRRAGEELPREPAREGEQPSCAGRAASVRNVSRPRREASRRPDGPDVNPQV